MLASVDVSQVLGFDAGPDSFYNAPNPPWVAGSSPGWYYGPSPENHPDMWCLHDYMCRLLDYYPNALHCPKPKPTPSPTTTTKTVATTTTTTTTDTVTVTVTPVPSDGYVQIFSNITAAVQADDFMTFGLTETVDDCKAMCDSVPGCTFVNTYHDVNGKGGSTELTCSLFQFCHTAADADNRGGQSQPDGSIDFIINSDGWCKEGNPVTSSAPAPTSTASPSPPTTTAAPTTTAKPTTTSKTSAAPTQTAVPYYSQCGGYGYTGSTKWYVQGSSDDVCLPFLPFNQPLSLQVYLHQL
ncbi:hypothetical protein CPC08DRAFT_640812 [Agrocybe pediades]|nr:hypothetical protein CPC08DRAFT_640812 [Agrocybe pediades]